MVLKSILISVLTYCYDEFIPLITDQMTEMCKGDALALSMEMHSEDVSTFRMRQLN